MNKHQFDIEVALEVGVLPSILLDSVRRWVEYNARNNTNYYEGQYWAYNSREAWAKEFSYLSKEQVRRALDKLKEAEFIITGNFNKLGFDRTLWYTLTPKAIKILYGCDVDLTLPIWQQCQMHLANLPNGSGENATPIPSINTSIKKEIYKEKRTRASAPAFTPPSLEDVVEYAKSRNSNVDAKFFYDYYNSSRWVDATGKPVKNWKQKFVTWDNRDKKNNPTPTNVYSSLESGTHFEIGLEDEDFLGLRGK